ncbi:hypothetical protein E2C01_045719 [Portunus trituberculatus]|uniref:Uncharacterized protein n=1 Tax=Portunus trituberculatus TaxID=210409 RepID=A0A5B7G370_PORTR|nr:hypothetical protein [Portunus trituberculatus]
MEVPVAFYLCQLGGEGRPEEYSVKDKDINSLSHSFRLCKSRVDSLDAHHGTPPSMAAARVASPSLPEKGGWEGSCESCPQRCDDFEYTIATTTITFATATATATVISITTAKNTATKTTIIAAAVSTAFPRFPHCPNISDGKSTRCRPFPAVVREWY